MRQSYKGIEEAIKLYTVEEIDKIVKENEARIVEYCKELERDYAETDAYEDIRVLFDLRDYKLYIQIIGQGIAEELVKGIEEGLVVEVYNFRTGDLGDMVFEGLEYIDDCEASQLYRLYKKGEIEEEEYLNKYDTGYTALD